MRTCNDGLELYELEDLNAMTYEEVLQLWQDAHDYTDGPYGRNYSHDIAFSKEALEALVSYMLPPELQGHIKSPTLSECYYITDRHGRPSANGFYSPKRKTMHPKTAANLARGSKRYGFGHIMNEIANDW